ncbi:aminotransferase class I/II-fold pyridoxal phosphate-dependent enzyme [Halorussus gelatinilyticus]|uniref:Aminotransferase class I/II-fold pyridoxal phosphate-dependent enzyme n=1 Tax=Halorussus gelatinilyticus TaxID=2937524 RepID=A0A8U0IID5_9EURY|nr:aminotransferase class I/II-fold pyridoxal phosphate-dependent enzyme [Halorussus gelatinilyticus]UPW00032.1 aminotransferase class I/II-fold pyridoxal phosphate-dependent enzyme [Halorussus gelatinilyticus]
MFPDIAYLDWITGRPETAEYDLGSSDLRRAPAGPDGVVPPALTGVVAGEATLRDRLAEIYGVESENVLVTAGGTHANFLAAAAAVTDAEAAARAAEESGDGGNGGVSDGESTATPRVLVEKPGYEPLRATPDAVGATVDRFLRTPDDGYPLDPGRVDAALVADTALVTVTNRHNPSGRLTDRETLAETARVVGDGDARLLVDEVYAPFRAEPGEGPFGGPTAAGLPNTVVTNSLTKFFGFGDVRIGWLVADAAFVERARSVAHHVPAVAEPSRRLAGRALAAADRLAEGSRERVRTNRAALAEFVASRADLSGRVEPGSPYAFLAHDAADGDDVAAAASAAGVLVVPGRFFDDAERFRVGACQDPERVRAGLDRLGGVLDSLAE